MKKIVLILLSFGLAGEMEVDGGLTVTEGVTASTFSGNGGGLTGIGIKPERIYSFMNRGDTYSLSVPEGKVWYVSITIFGYMSTSYIMVKGEQISLVDGNARTAGNPFNFYLFPGETISSYSSYSGEDNRDYFLTIYEYSISGSGTDQGIPYIEP